MLQLEQASNEGRKLMLPEHQHSWVHSCALDKTLTATLWCGHAVHIAEIKPHV